MWHVSVSVWVADGSRKRNSPEIAEREAVRLLRGVGGDREWWIWNLNEVTPYIGHLRVALTAEEYAQVPPARVVADAGESGPERPRTR